MCWTKSAERQKEGGYKASLSHKCGWNCAQNGLVLKRCHSWSYAIRQTQTGFVTRIKDNAVSDTVTDRELEENIRSGVEKDEIIEIQVKNDNGTKPLKLCKVQFYDRVLKRRFEFLTNLVEMRADLIAAIYKLRWQIELLCKQLKQYFPVKYFLRNNENAKKYRYTVP